MRLVISISADPPAVQSLVSRARRGTDRRRPSPFGRRGRTKSLRRRSSVGKRLTGREFRDRRRQIRVGVAVRRDQPADPRQDVTKVRPVERRPDPGTRGMPNSRIASRPPGRSTRCSSRQPALDVRPRCGCRRRPSRHRTTRPASGSRVASPRTRCTAIRQTRAPDLRPGRSPASRPRSPRRPPAPARPDVARRGLDREIGRAGAHVEHALAVRSARSARTARRRQRASRPALST